MKTVRILVVDDHEVVRQGIRTLLEAQSGWKICGEAATGSEGIKQAKRLNPDVVVLDITMPESDGMEAIRQIRNAVPAAEVLILTIHEADELLREVLEAGARGYVAKSDAARDLVAAVDAMRLHKPFFSSTALKSLMASYVGENDWSDKHRTSGSHLTRREREVARLLGGGKGNKEIATALSISVRTVETHRTSIMRKLRLHSIGDLVRYTIRKKMVQP